MAIQAPTISYGTAGVSAIPTDQLNLMFDTLEKHNVKELDTASIYVRSEAILGEVGAPKRFTVSTKAPGFKDGGMSRDKVLAGIDQSLKDLGVDKVDIYYLHAPDPTTPIEETLSAISEIYKAGKFQRFGLSNFRPQDVQKIYDIQSSTNSVLPTVFQGNYNAVSRHIEDDLFPLLRKLGISFYAYSPIAGGFLVKTSDRVRAQEDHGRFGKNARTGKMYHTLYAKESLLAALDEWGKIAEDAGISKASLAYRWMAFHSHLKAEHGDAIIVGASKVAQLEESLTAIEAGPLEVGIAGRASALWEGVRHEAPLDNWNSYASTNK